MRGQGKEEVMYKEEVREDGAARGVEGDGGLLVRLVEDDKVRKVVAEGHTRSGGEERRGMIRGGRRERDRGGSGGGWGGRQRGRSFGGERGRRRDSGGSRGGFLLEFVVSGEDGSLANLEILGVF